MIGTRSAQGLGPVKPKEDGQAGNTRTNSNAAISLSRDTAALSDPEIKDNQKHQPTIVPSSSLSEPISPALSPDAHMGRRVVKMAPVALDFGPSPCTGPSDPAIPLYSVDSTASPPIEFLPDGSGQAADLPSSIMAINLDDDCEDTPSCSHAVAIDASAENAPTFIPAWRRSFREQISQARVRKDGADASRNGAFPLL
jgi:hypothetical protein